MATQIITSSSSGSSSEDQFGCPVCMEIPPGEIFQCEDGHTICGQCFANLSACPQCRAPYGWLKIRNRAVESLLDGMSFPCANQEQGCIALMKRGEMKGHAEICEFGGQPIPICKMLGYLDCAYKVSRTDLQRAADHFATQHQTPVVTGTSVDVTVEMGEDSLNSFPFLETRWTPVLLKLSLNDRTLLGIIYSKTHREDRSFSMSCVLIEDKLNTLESEGEASFHVNPSGSNNSGLKYSVNYPLLKITNRTTSFKELLPAFKIPLDYLKGHFLTENQVKVRVVVGRDSHLQQQVIISSNSSVHVLPTPNPEALSNTRIYCDVCRANPLTSVRYKCLQCPDFDLCGACMSRKEHVQHVFALIVNNRQAHHLAVLADFGKRPILTEVFGSYQRRPTRAHFRASCDGCGLDPIVGVARYTCLCCSAVDSCPTCVDKGYHPHHVFGVILNGEQEDLLDSKQSAGARLIPSMRNLTETGV